MTAALVQDRVHFVEPMPGFADAEFDLSPIDDRSMLFALRSVDNPDLRFVLTYPERFFRGYDPDLPDDLYEELGSPEVEVLNVVSISSGLTDATANLRAPVVIAPRTGRAKQIVLDDDSLPMQKLLIDRAA